MHIELSGASTSKLYEAMVLLNADWLKEGDVATLNFQDGRVVSYKYSSEWVESDFVLTPNVEVS